MEVLLKPKAEDEKMKEPLIYVYAYEGSCCAGPYGAGTA